MATSSRPAGGGRRSRFVVLLVVVVALMVNLPLVHYTWLRWQLDRSGVEVTARVADDTVRDGRSYVGFVLPAEVDGEQLARDERGWTVQVDDEVRERAVADGEIAVRVLPGRPSEFSVDGQVRGSGPWVTTLVADVALIAGALLLWRFRRALRPQLVLLATADLERCPPGGVLDRLQGDEYVVHGDIESMEEDRVLLAVGDRRVLVELDGHHNPASYQQSVRVRGRMVG